MDNARFALIALVVFGHMLEPVPGTHPLLAATYQFVYLFHIPAFAFLSGLVARERPDGRLLETVALRLLLPYLVFQALYALAATLPGWPDAGPDGVATPYWLLWYLLSLACWRLLLPLFAPWRYRMAIAIAIALMAGFADDIGYFLSLSRTLVFFPLFLLGWQVAQAPPQARQWRRWRPAAALLLAGLFGLSLVMGNIDPRWLYGSVGYASLDTGPLQGALLRLAQLTGAIAATLAFLALVPQRSLSISRLGQGSLGAYLLHGFLVKTAVAMGLFGLLASQPWGVILPLLLALGTMLAAVLSTRLVQRAMTPLTSPRWIERHLFDGMLPQSSSRRSGGR